MDGAPSRVGVAGGVAVARGIVDGGLWGNRRGWRDRLDGCCSEEREFALAASADVADGAGG